MNNNIIAKKHRKKLKRQYLQTEKEKLKELSFLSKDQLCSLLYFIERELTKTNCPNGFVFAKKWANDNKYDWEEIEPSLNDLGAFCDCEILNNIKVDEIF